MKKNKLFLLSFLALMFTATSCVNDLDVTPIDPNIATSDNVFKDPAAYKQALAKIYASYAIGGQQGGGGGRPDIAGIDEGFGNYVRQLWGLQELPTDEAIMAWDDATIKDFHAQSWSPNDVFIAALYSRIFYTVAISNEFVRTSNDAIAEGKDVANMKLYQAEARFLRAFSYYHAIDMFGNVPFVTEADKPGAFLPTRTTRPALFSYIESELKALETELAEPKTNEYGRVDRVAAWMLLAKLYLNAEVYIGTPKYTEAITYLNKVISSGYSIDPVYKNVFTADNHLSPEIIFPISFDGQNTQGYGGMTFVLHASNGGGMPLNGIDGGWGGIRSISTFVEKFGANEADFTDAQPEFPGIPDKRGMFYHKPENWTWEITNVGNFTHGIGSTKFKNITSTGAEAPNVHPTFVSVDFPAFRLADAYLMYAEAVKRGGSGGSLATAVGYVNTLRARAGVPAIAEADMTLDFLLDERGRELYWECHRRTDLIRFGQFTDGTYVWDWKGGVAGGVATPSYRDLYPIPTNDITANPNLIQNPGY